MVSSGGQVVVKLRIESPKLLFTMEAISHGQGKGERLVRAQQALSWKVRRLERFICLGKGHT